MSFDSSPVLSSAGAESTLADKFAQFAATQSPLEIPGAVYFLFGPRRHDWCVVIPVINEGERIRNQLRNMAALALGADVVIVDGGSKDGSLDEAFLKEMGVRTLIVKTGPGKLSAQLRLGMHFAMAEGYRGVVTVDGNGKDGIGAIPDFIQKLAEGHGFVQGSRYAPGGRAVNTPLERSLAVRLLHAPLLSLAARFRYTDTTNGFRGFSRGLLLDDRVQVFRNIFDTYNLHFYLSVRAPRLGYKVCEIGVTRTYPKGEVPTKISGLKGKWLILRQLLAAVTGRYDPPGR